MKLSLSVLSILFVGFSSVGFAAPASAPITICGVIMLGDQSYSDTKILIDQEGTEHVEAKFASIYSDESPDFNNKLPEYANQRICVRAQMPSSNDGDVVVVGFPAANEQK